MALVFHYKSSFALLLLLLLLLLYLCGSLMASSFSSYTIACSHQKTTPLAPLHSFLSSLSSSFKPLLKDWKQLKWQMDVGKSMRNSSMNLLDAFVATIYKFEEQPSFNEGNFAPVDETSEEVVVEVSKGAIPQDFPQGVYIRNGPNFLYPFQTRASSIFGNTTYSWLEGDGMLHATYFDRDDEGDWKISYKNKYVESETFLMDKERNKLGFIPTACGQPLPIILAFILNLLRFGKEVRYFSNTNVFEHGGKFYAIAETYLPLEINPSNLSTLKEWDINGSWNGPFTSHPKKVPRTGELVTMGVSIRSPHYVLGVISADGKKMLHKVDLKFKSGNLIHELGVTEHYNIILDYPLNFGLERSFIGKPFIQFNKNGKSRIGVMPRFGDEKSLLWFDVKNHCSFHLINCFEDGDEVIIRGCRMLDSIITSKYYSADEVENRRRAFSEPNDKSNDFDPSKDGTLFSLPYEWRLNLQTLEVKEGYLTMKNRAMDFPTINNHFIGIKNKYAYLQVIDSLSSSKTGMIKYNMLAKICFEDEGKKENGENVEIEYHFLEDYHFCSGLQFVEKLNATEEDDGWLVCYVHDEDKNKSKVYIIDAKNFSGAPHTVIELPPRVPYGFHGIFLYK